MKKHEKGFGIPEIILVILVVGLMVTLGWIYFNNRNKDNTTADNNAETTQQTETETETPTDPNKGYLVVKQWGLRFKQPSDLVDVQYRIFGDTLAFYAKPKGYDVDYRTNYEATQDGSPKYAIGKVYRSTDSTKPFDGDSTRQGKKLGSYYYYTAHAFSNLSTGAGPLGLYFDDSCDQDDSGAKCQTFIDAETKAFKLMNEDGGLLNSIELAQ